MGRGCVRYRLVPLTVFFTYPDYLAHNALRNNSSMSHRGIFSKPHLSLIKTTRRDLCVPREFDRSISTVHVYAHTHTRARARTHTHTLTLRHARTRTHKHTNPLKLMFFFSVDVYYHICWRLKLEGETKMRVCTVERDDDRRHDSFMTLVQCSHSWKPQ